MAAGPEDILQMQVARFLKIAAPGLLFWHVPNGGKRHPAEARKFKDMGVLPGVADLCFVLPEGKAAFIELKHGKNPQQPTQKQFQAACDAAGAAYAICRSLAEVEAALTAWGVRLRARGQ